MEEFKTKIFTLDNETDQILSDDKTSNLINSDLKTVQIHPKFNGSIGKKKKIKDVNPYYLYFPDFYLKELKNSFLTFICWISILIISVAICTWFTCEIIFSSAINNWTLLTIVPILGLIISLFVVYMMSYINFKNEAKNINFKDEKIVSINIQKLYKKLKIGYINVNWMSTLSYCVFLLALLIDCIISWSIFGGTFGDVYKPILQENNYAYVFVFWICVAGVMITFAIHALLLVSNYVRYSRIENFYNFIIVPNEEIVILKKRNNRRDMIIFLAIIATLLLVVWFIYRLFKKTNKTKVVVNA